MVPDLDELEELAKAKIDESKRVDALANQEKHNMLFEERLRAIEGKGFLGQLDARELSLVPDLVIPPKFKIPDFDKYDGTSCPNAHLTMFCRTMSGYTDDEKLLIHCFHYSLAGSAKRWYNQLSRLNIQSWRQLAQAFLEQYKHISDMIPDRLSLQNMEKLPTETFRQYAQKWRDLATQVQPPLTEKETTVMFINTLKGPYYKKMVGNATRNFADMVISGEMIESAIKNGKMGGEDAGSSKKAATAKKKDGEVHTVGSGEPHLPNLYPYQPQQMYNPYYPPQYPYYPMPSQPVVAANYSQPATAPTATTNRNRTEQRPQRQNNEKLTFTPIPISYGELYPKLLQANLVTPSFIEPYKPPFPDWYDANATCVHHPGIQGHSIENCLSFKKRVQNLLNQGVLKFDNQDKSNITTNPLPNRDAGKV